LVRARTASAIPALVTADHISDKLPYCNRRNKTHFLNNWTEIITVLWIIPMPYL
jgi:hypothetical protein